MSVTERSLDLNADLGEGRPNDHELLALVTSASISCGAHAGDRTAILTTLRDAQARGVVVGAHPGFADRAHFGRREQTISAQETERLVLDQVGDLKVLADEAGVSLCYVKPHGALYNQAQRQAEVAEGVINALNYLDLPLLGQPGTPLESLARERGVRFVTEGFPERRYQADGRLVPRSEPDAVLTEPAQIEAQVLRLVEQRVATLCIHGDDPRAVASASWVRDVLLRRGLALKSFA